MSFDLSHFNLTFVKLANGSHHFTYTVNDEFFEHFGNQEVNQANVTFEASVLKSDSMIIVDLKGFGSLTSVCDRCLNPVSFQVEPVFKVIAHLNSMAEPDNSNDDLNIQLLYLRSSDFELNLASSIYESFLPCIPMVKSCEILEDKECDSTVIQRINEKQIDAENSDPRWEKLKELLKNKEK